MHTHIIKDMIRNLDNAGLLQDKEKAIEILEDYWTTNMAIVWNVDDIIGVAEQKGLDITKEQACEVLETLLDNHDADLGVNWDTISYALDGMEDYLVDN